MAIARRLDDALTSGRFAVTAELGPPRDPDSATIRAAAAAFAGLVDAVNVTDNQAATVKVSALACAALLIDEGVDPILQITGRDRNLLAAQSDLLGAWMFGVRTVLALSGDPLPVGPYDALATHVRDLDARRLARLITRMNGGSLAAGERLRRPTAFRIVGAANPLVDSPERLTSKLDSGVTLLQSNVVYDIERFAAWLAPLVRLGITQRAPLLVGVTPPRSRRMLEHLHHNIPGIEVDEATFARMDGLEGDAAKAEGIEIAAEVIERLRSIPGVAGVHLMAPGWDTEALPWLVERAGLAYLSKVSDGGSPAARAKGPHVKADE
ncbi:MAG: methylenetetrahydrofolate reductase [Solirubrobacterales bacterium]|nr:methylenetetrahydrofolate reductase [Solirubrobacterales bacterium]